VRRIFWRGRNAGGGADSFSPFRLTNRRAENCKDASECVDKFDHIRKIRCNDVTFSPSPQLHSRTAIDPDILFMIPYGDQVPDRGCPAGFGRFPHLLLSPGTRESDEAASVDLRKPGRGSPPEERYRCAATAPGKSFSEIHIRGMTVCSNGRSAAADCMSTGRNLSRP
jgi:hypothetical protein